MLSFCLFAAGQEAQVPARISSAAQAYLDHVLDLMQAHALHTNEIDWPAVRSETLKRAAGAQTTADTYPAIFYALTQLKERHSFLRIPDALPDADRERAQASMSEILGQYKNQAPRHPNAVFRDRSVPSGHLINAGDAVFAYIVIPACGSKHSNMQENQGDFQAYADALHSIAASLEASHPWGWIVDLRGNGGGNMYPMIAGIGMVLGEGTLGYFVSASGAEEPWFYRHGSAGGVVGSKESTMAQVRGDPFVLPDLPPVAVLLDSGTISSGEAVAISFIGRSRTKSFGAHTYGLSTGNEGYPLSDGASLFLCDVIEADREHRTYPDGIEPDVVLSEPFVLPSEEADPVIQAAQQWLLTLRTQSQRSRELTLPTVAAPR
jgi:C-terminal processing protease CtpA/Prc